MTGGALLRALVVGGTGGIGRAIAARLRQDGARVVIAGRDPVRARAAAAELGSVAVTGDAGDPGECAAMVAAAEAELGGIDALFSCAGGTAMPRLLADVPLEDVMGTITRSLAPTILPARAVLPGMSAQGGGSILCIASDAGKIATPGEVAIGAAMAAIMMFCRGMAIEAKRQGIRVNCLTPSIVEGTALHDSLMADAFAGRLFARAKALAHLGVVQPGGPCRDGGLPGFARGRAGHRTVHFGHRWDFGPVTAAGEDARFCLGAHDPVRWVFRRYPTASQTTRR